MISQLMSVGSTAFYHVEITCLEILNRNIANSFKLIKHVSYQRDVLLFSKICGLFADTKLSAMLQSELLQSMQPCSSGSDTGSTAPGMRLNLGEITV